MKVKRTPGPGMQKLKILLDAIRNAEAKVGVVDPVRYEDGTPVAYVAAIQEFGFAGRSIPPRPTWRPTIQNNSEKWRGITRQLVKKIGDGGQDTLKVLAILGEVAAGDVRQAISQVYSPPLSPATLHLRKLKREGTKIGGKLVGEVVRGIESGALSEDVSGVSTKPLVFDGILIGSITSQVNEK